MSRLKAFFREEDGAVAIQYGLVASMIVISMMVAFQYVSIATQGLYNSLLDAVVLANAS